MNTDPSSEPTLSISEVVDRTGIPATSLRMWELRYKWPRPERTAHGHRRYSTHLVSILEQVRAMMDRGRTIGDLMRDRWWQHLLFPEPAPAVRPAPLLPAWGSIPAPASRFGRETRARLEAALLADDQHTMRWAHAIAQRLHPAERELAVEAVVRLWHRHQQEHSRPLLDGDRRLPHRA